MRRPDSMPQRIVHFVNRARTGEICGVSMITPTLETKCVPSRYLYAGQDIKRSCLSFWRRRQNCWSRLRKKKEKGCSLRSIMQIVKIFHGCMEMSFAYLVKGVATWNPEFRTELESTIQSSSVAYKSYVRLEDQESSRCYVHLSKLRVKVRRLKNSTISTY